MFSALTVLALAAMAVVSPPRASADERIFTLINGTQRTSTECYVSASDTQSWEEDVLGRDVLNAGESVTVRFSRNDADAGKCLYDILVVTRDGGEGILSAVDLCTTATVTFY